MTCSVYIVAAPGDNGPVKIGIASSPIDRLRALQTASFLPLELFHSQEFMDRASAIAAEREMHACLDDRRMIGEWFRVSPVEAMYLFMLRYDPEIADVDQ